VEGGICTQAKDCRMTFKFAPFPREEGPAGNSLHTKRFPKSREKSFARLLRERPPERLALAGSKQINKYRNGQRERELAKEPTPLGAHLTERLNKWTLAPGKSNAHLLQRRKKVR